MIRFITEHDFNLLQTINQYNYGALLNNYHYHGLLLDNKSFIIYQYIKPEAEIIFIATKSEDQHQGLAKKLINIFINSLPMNSCIFCEVDSANHHAISLYRHIGMQQFHIRPSYYDNGHDALCFKMLKDS